MMFSLLILLLMAHTNPEIAQRHQPNTIFLLAGQSNMAGRGGVTNNTITHNLTWDGFIPPMSFPNPSILRLTANLTWVEAHEPLHADIDVTKTNGVGPGMPFANTLLKNSPDVGVIGLVPCAIGGTNISEWKQGSLLYNQMLTRALASVQGGGRILAILWYQGESDTMDREDAESYKVKLKRFFFHVRSDLQSPSLPIIQVALASGGAYTETIRKAQLGIELPNVLTVDAKDLPLEPDGLHLTTEAQVKLGEMMANAFLNLLPAPLPSRLSNSAPQWFCTSVLDFSFLSILKVLIWALVNVAL